MVVFGAYVVSVYALATLPGKSRRRRLASWAFSAAFHATVVTYVAVGLRWGFEAAIIVLMPEVATLLLSIGGLRLAGRESACASGRVSRR